MILLIIIFFFLLEIAIVLFAGFMGIVGLILSIALPIVGIMILVKWIIYIKENKEKIQKDIQNSKTIKKFIGILKILLKIGIVLAIISIIIILIYKKTFTPTLENYLGKYEVDGGRYYHYDLTIEENSKCTFVDESKDFNEYQCSYTYGDNNTITLSIESLEKTYSLYLNCDYNFTKEIDNNWGQDYLLCGPDARRHSHYFKIEK